MKNDEKKNPGPTEGLPPNAPVLRAMFPSGRPSDKCSVPGLTAGLKTLAAQAVELNANEARLEQQNRVVAARMDRMEQIVLDHVDEKGERVHGLAREQESHQRRLAQLETKVSEFLLDSKTTSIYVTEYLPEFVSDHARWPTPAEAREAYGAISNRIQKIALEQQAEQDLFERVATKAFRCQFCVYWRKASSIVVPGSDAPVDTCAQPGIAVSCSACGFIHPRPVDPMNITDNCTKCKAPLRREIEVGENVQTCCTLFSANDDLFKEFCLKEGISKTFIDRIQRQVAAAKAAANDVVTPGESGVAVPRDPTAKPLEP